MLNLYIATDNLINNDLMILRSFTVLDLFAACKLGWLLKGIAKILLVCVKEDSCLFLDCETENLSVPADEPL